MPPVYACIFTYQNIPLHSMGVVFRQSVKTAIVLFFGALLGLAVIYLSTRFIIDKQQFGFTRTLTTAAVVASQILLFGIHSTLSVYIHKYADGDKRKAVLIAITFSAPMVIAVLASALYFLFHNSIISMFQPQDVPMLGRYFMWLPVLAVFYIYQNLLDSYLSSQMKVAIPNFMREIVVRILTLVFIVLFGYGYIGFPVLVAGMVLIYIIPLLLMLIIAMRTKAFSLSFNFNAFSKPEWKEIIHFTWYHSLWSITISLMGFLDALMLAPLDKSGLKATAIYAIAVYIMSFMQLPYKAMSPASFPDLAKAYNDNDMPRVRNVFRRVSLNILIVTVGVMVLIFSNLNNAAILINNGYDAIIPLVYIMALGRLIDIATGMNDQVLSLSKYYKANFYMSLGLVVVMVIFYYILIPRYGIFGAAWGTTITYSIYNIWKTIYIWSKLKIFPLSNKSAYVLLAAAAAFLVGHYLPFVSNVYADTAVRIILVSIIYIVALIILKPSEDLQVYLASIRKNKRLF